MPAVPPRGASATDHSTPQHSHTPPPFARAASGDGAPPRWRTRSEQISRPPAGAGPPNTNLSFSWGLACATMRCRRLQRSASTNTTSRRPTARNAFAITCEDHPGQKLIMNRPGWFGRCAGPASRRRIRTPNAGCPHARDRVRRNVVELTELPTGQRGRPSKALSAQQADDVLIKTAADRLHPYIVVSLLTGARTEELRALRWTHVHLEGRATAIPPVPPYIEVWRSVRATGDTKTRRSRRTLALPGRCIDALRAQRVQQAADRLAAGPSWKELGLVFATQSQ